MIVIDGSQGEGGGQILRTSLALSLVSGAPFRVERVRAGRARPGLMRQHLTAVKAAATVGRASVAGAEVGSQTLEFRPGAPAAGEYTFAVGSAGSATLVLQTVLPALLATRAPSRLVFEGGTHNPMAPTFDFVARVFLPILQRMGLAIRATLERHGFYPAGGGRFVVELAPSAPLGSLELVERGAVRARRATALFASLPFDVARRELAAVRARLDWSEAECRPLDASQRSDGPGNVLQLEVECERVTELVTAFGERGLPAEVVAARAADELMQYLAADVPVGAHLADQLVLPLALGAGGVFRSLPPTPHTTTQIDIVRRFLDVPITTRALTPTAHHYEVTPR